MGARQVRISRAEKKSFWLSFRFADDPLGIRALRRTPFLESSFELFKIRKVRIVEVGLEVAKRRWKRIESVIGHDDGLGILEFGESLHVEAIVGVGAVGLRRGEVGPMGNGLAGE